MQLRNKCSVWALALCLVTAASVRAAGPWHVATNGVDEAGRDGLSWAEAWASIGYAVGQASAGTIHVSNGVYTLSEQISVTKALTIEGVNGREHTIVDANQTGRCFSLNNAGAVLRGLTITNGRTTAAAGGGVYLQSGKVEQCRIAGNAATNNWGGGIHIYNTAANTTNHVTDCLIHGNTATMGAGIAISDAYYGSRISAVIEGCEISGNTAIGLPTGGTGEAGGGAIWFQGKHVTVRNCRLADNVVDGQGNPGKSARGGGFSSHATHFSALIENCEVVDNIVTNSPNVCGGGGLHLSGNQHVVRNSLVARNWVRLRGGGVLTDRENTTNRFESCTIIDNYDLIGGGSGFYLSGNGFDEVWNSVVYSNRVANNWYFGNNARTNYIHYTCTPTLSHQGNITAAPRFVDMAGGDYRLRSTSPGLHAGTNVAWMAAATDLDGNPRIDKISGQVDMGCYERAYAGSMLFVR